MKREKDIVMPKGKFNEYLDASQIVCMGCAYLSEAKCKHCPVRKTLDRIKEAEI